MVRDLVVVGTSAAGGEVLCTMVQGVPSGDPPGAAMERLVIDHVRHPAKIVGLVVQEPPETKPPADELPAAGLGALCFGALCFVSHPGGGGSGRSILPGGVW